MRSSGGSSTPVETRGICSGRKVILNHPNLLNFWARLDTMLWMNGKLCKITVMMVLVAIINFRNVEIRIIGRAAVTGNHQWICCNEFGTEAFTSEMLCEDRGFFLEIADLIKGLGLTILKGVMEARNDNVWARFAVEAYTDVTRMNIFLSLVQLLEPNAVTQQGVANLNMNTNMMNIPSTTMTSHLQ